MKDLNIDLIGLYEIYIYIYRREDPLDLNFETQLFRTTKYLIKNRIKTFDFLFKKFMIIHHGYF